MLKKWFPVVLLVIFISACNRGKESSSSPVATASTTSTTTPPNDPLFDDQWHLQNTGQGGGTAGEDANVVPAWSGGYNGQGITVVVVDDGMEIAHEDLAPNVILGWSYNYIDASTDPTGDSADMNYSNPSFHGTAVTGIIGARDLNNIGVRGASPRSGLLGYNFLQKTTVTNLVDSMTRNIASINISNNSWGPGGEWGQLYPSELVWRNAVDTGLATGAGGLGTSYMFAAGNSGIFNISNANYNGYANYRGVMAVAALADDGTKASYSERGANLWVSAYAGEFCDSHTVTTTDRTGSEGYNVDGSGDYADTNYTKCFNGTSAATPLASGVVALLLDANPGLGWRDVRLILAQSARKNHPADAEWTTNGAGYHINHNYGFGVLDAQAAVNTAIGWSNVGPEVTHSTGLSSPGLAIPDNNATGVSSTLAVSGSGINSIEYVEITFSAADHSYFGDLEVTLTNETTGTFSILAENHTCWDVEPVTPVQVVCAPSFNGWVFGSSRHLGEAADGNWNLRVKDLAAVDTGTFQSWRLKFYGR